MLKLYSEEAREAAKVALQALQRRAAELLGGRPLAVQLRGLASMNDNPSAVSEWLACCCCCFIRLLLSWADGTACACAPCLDLTPMSPLFSHNRCTFFTAACTTPPAAPAAWPACRPCAPPPSRLSLQQGSCCRKISGR